METRSQYTQGTSGSAFAEGVAPTFENMLGTVMCVIESSSQVKVQRSIFQLEAPPQGGINKQSPKTGKQQK